MILILGILGIFLVSLFLSLLSAVKQWDSKDIFIVFVLISGLILVVVLITWPITRLVCIPADIKQFEATEETIAIARNNINITPFELAAIQQKIIETNRWLASSQFLAKSQLTNWFWPKKIFELEPIR